MYKHSIFEFNPCNFRSRFIMCGFSDKNKLPWIFKHFKWEIHYNLEHHIALWWTMNGLHRVLFLSHSHSVHSQLTIEQQQLLDCAGIVNKYLFHHEWHAIKKHKMPLMHTARRLFGAHSMSRARCSFREALISFKFFVFVRFLFI